MFGRAFPQGAGAGGGLGGAAGTSALPFAGGGGIAGLASLPKVMLVTAGLLATGVALAVPGFSNLLDTTTPAASTMPGPVRTAIEVSQPAAPGGAVIPAAIVPVAVPEPASVLTFLVAVTGTIVTRRRRRHTRTNAD